MWVDMTDALLLANARRKARRGDPLPTDLIVELLARGFDPSRL